MRLSARGGPAEIIDIVIGSTALSGPAEIIDIVIGSTALRSELWRHSSHFASA
jgi:hypothetical protein